jgi:hypothetical protein
MEKQRHGGEETYIENIKLQLLYLTLLFRGSSITEMAPGIQNAKRKYSLAARSASPREEKRHLSFYAVSAVERLPSAGFFLSL